MSYLYLFLAIVTEVIGTSMLKISEGFTRTGPSIVVVISYGAAFYFLSLVLKSVSVALAYAIWCGLGIVLIALIDIFYFRQSLDPAAILGMILILAGVSVIHLFSRNMNP